MDKDKSEIKKEKKKKKPIAIKKIHIWQATTIVFIILFVISLFNIFSSGISEDVVKSTIEELSGATVTEIKESNGFYAAKVQTDEGQEGVIYMSLDGELLFQGAVNVEVLREYIKNADKITGSTTQQTQQTQEQYSTEDIKKIKDFVKCLEEKGVKIYGADWCGWTKKLVVDTFGGFDIVAPIYVECTKDKELCDKEQVRGYPTIKINGNDYQGQRTFEGFAGVTGCAAPDLNLQVASGSDDVQCS